MNLQELEEDLDERSLSITIHPAGTGWVVWLFPADDPAQMIIEEGSDLVKMIAAALKKWDGDGGLSAPTGDEALMATRLPGGGVGWRRKGASLDPGEKPLEAQRQEDGTIVWREKESE